jgi:hypothetical protein
MFGKSITIVIALDSLDQVISQSIEKVIDKLMPEDKDRFYNLLKLKYKFDFRHSSKTFYTFYLALKETYPLKHFAIESDIIRTMHEDTLNGKYKLTEEIDAFIIMTTIIQEDEKRTMDQIKGRLDVIDNEREMIQRELSDKTRRVDKLNQYFSQIDVNLKEREEELKKEKAH